MTCPESLQLESLTLARDAGVTTGSTVDICTSNHLETSEAITSASMESDDDDETTSIRTGRSVSVHGSSAIMNASFCGDTAGGSAAFSVGGVSISSNMNEVGCFFSEHKTLQGDIPLKVVKYARRRLAKAKVVLSTSALPLVTHDAIELDALLGEGSFSSVYSVASMELESASFPSSDQVVVKLLRKKLIKTPPMLAACAADLVKEGILLSRLDSPHILKVWGWAPWGVDAYGSSGRHDAFFLVLGRLETTLSDKLKDWRKFQLRKGIGWKVWKSSAVLQRKWESFQERMAVVDQLAQAVVYLHSQNVLHRDLKPDNIGFDANGVLKVFDFDVARLLPVTSSVNATFQMTKRVGSPRYMSPECARGEAYNAKADVYTFALLVHELYSLEKPYDDVPSELHDELVFYQGARPFLSKTWPTLFQQTLQQAWSEKVVHRPTMVQLQRTWQQELKAVVLQDKQRKYTKTPFATPTTTKKDTTPVVSPEQTKSGSITIIPTSSTCNSNNTNVMPPSKGYSWEASARTTLTEYADVSESTSMDPIALVAM